MSVTKTDSLISIPISDENKKLVLSLASLGPNPNQDLLRIIDAELVTKTCRPLAINDLINKHIFEGLKGHQELECHPLHKNSHAFIYVYDKSQHSLFTLMKKYRLDEIRKMPISNILVHYLSELGRFNQSLVEYLPIQTVLELSDLELFGEEILEGFTSNIIDSIKNKIQDEIKCFTLLTYELTENEITSIEAFILSSDLSIISHENWSKFLPKRITTSPSSEDINPDKLASERNDEGLGKRKEKKPENLVKLKRKNL